MDNLEGHAKAFKIGQLMGELIRNVSLITGDIDSAIEEVEDGLKLIRKLFKAAESPGDE